VRRGEAPQEVRLRVEGAVAELVLDAPQRRNALTAGMASQLAGALDRVESDEQIGALVIRGAGGSFCAGADLSAISAAGSDPAADEPFTVFSAIYELFVRVAELPVPTIAAVRGGAVGAGLNLALATDVRVVADDARLLSGFLRIGVHPGGGHFQLLERLAGPERAVAMSLLGVEVAGRDAVGWGLALESLPDDRVQPRALELAASVNDAELARSATRSWRAYREASGVTPRLLVRAEQASQMWSFRRKAAAG